MAYYLTEEDKNDLYNDDHEIYYNLTFALNEHMYYRNIIYITCDYVCKYRRINHLIEYTLPVHIGHTKSAISLHLNDYFISPLFQIIWSYYYDQITISYSSCRLTSSFEFTFSFDSNFKNIFLQMSCSRKIQSSYKRYESIPKYIPEYLDLASLQYFLHSTFVKAVNVRSLLYSS